MIKKVIVICLTIFLLLLCACHSSAQTEASSSQILATTAPVAEIAEAITQGTDLQVQTLIQEPVSCLHDYSLSVTQMKTIENARILIVSGHGLEHFMHDVLSECETVIDAGRDIIPLDTEHHEADPHIWMDPKNMVSMCKTIQTGLSAQFPQHAQLFEENADAYCQKLLALQEEGMRLLEELSCRELITFHDGFSYFAQAFDLQIAAAMEVEAGSEPSAKQLEKIIALVQERSIPAVFVEANGNTSAAQIVRTETNTQIFTLHMLMDLHDTDYCSVMRTNLETIKEALG